MPPTQTGLFLTAIFFQPGISFQYSNKQHLTGRYTSRYQKNGQENESLTHAFNVTSTYKQPDESEKQIPDIKGLPDKQDKAKWLLVFFYKCTQACILAMRKTPGNKRFFLIKWYTKSDMHYYLFSGRA